MKVTVIKENDKYYLEIERPDYMYGVYDVNIEVRKVMTVITRNIESYFDENNSSCSQYWDTYSMVTLIKEYFRENPNIRLIKIPYMRRYPTYLRCKRYGFLRLFRHYYNSLSKDFIENEIKVIKSR